MLTAQSRQKSFTDLSQRPLELEFGDHVLPRVSPTNGVIRFRAIGKLKIIERIGKLAYRLELPPSLSGVHNVFHISMLWKYLKDPDQILELPTLEVYEDMTVVSCPIHILECQSAS